MNKIERMESYSKIPVTGPLPPFAYWTGMTFTIPENYTVFYEVVKNKAGNFVGYNQFIPVELDDGDYHSFYPSILKMSLKEFDEYDEPTGKTIAVSGSVVEFIQKFDTLDDAINALAGKKIRVTDIKYVHIYKYRSKPVPTFDFVD